MDCGLRRAGVGWGRVDDTPVLRNLRCRKQFLCSGPTQALSRAQSQGSCFREVLERAGGRRQFFVGVLGAGIRLATKLPMDSHGRDELHAHRLGDNLADQRGPAAPTVLVLLEQSMLPVMYSIWGICGDSGWMGGADYSPHFSPKSFHGFNSSCLQCRWRGKSVGLWSQYKRTKGRPIGTADTSRDMCLPSSPQDSWEICRGMQLRLSQ